MAQRKKAKAAKSKRAGSRPARAVKKKTGRAATPARKKTARRKAAPEFNQEVMMAAWEKAMTPGESHRRLEPLIGTWATKTTFWMSPTAPPSTGDGISEHRWVLGGRFVEQVYRGTAMDMPFEGLGYTGYDNVQRKYVGNWMDSMGTGIMNNIGIGRPTAAQVAFVGRSIDPVTRKEVVYEMLVRIRDHDQHSYEMWTRSPAGKRYRAMLIEYKRQA